MGTWGKVAIAARLVRPEPEFFVAWTGLLTSGLRDGDMVLGPPVRIPHAIAANFLSRQFVTQSKCDSILFVDDDHYFESNALTQLRELGNDYDVFAGCYVQRSNPANPIAFNWRTDDPRRALSVKGHGVMDVDIVGLGFTLIRRKVFETLGDTPFEWVNGDGEDGAFCRKVKQAGMRVGVAFNVPIGHVINSIALWNQDTGKPEVTIKYFGPYETGKGD